MSWGQQGSSELILFGIPIPVSEDREAGRLDQQRRYYDLLQNSGDAAYITAIDGTILEMNMAGCKMLGATLEELLGSNAKDWYVNPGDRKKFRKEIEDQGTVNSYPLSLKRHDGSLLEVLITSTIWKIDDSPAGFIGLIQDVTKEHRAQELLAEREARFRMLASIAPVGIYLTNDVGGCIYVNEAWCALTGISSEDAKGPGWINTIYDEDFDQVTAAWDRLVNDGEEFALEYRFQSSTGRITWVSGKARPLLNENSIISGYIGVITDISERKLFEAALEASESQYRLLVENASDVVLTTDSDGCINYVNLAIETLTGYTSAEILGKHNADLASPESRSAVEGIFHSQIQEGIHERELEYPILTKSGEHRWVEQRSKLIKTETGIRGFEGVIRDITERKRAEEAEHQRLALAEALQETAAAINSTLDIDEVLDLILVSVKQVVPHDMVNIMLVEDGIATIARHRGYVDWGVDSEINGLKFSVEGLPNFRTMVETRRPFIIADTQDCPDWTVEPGTEWIRSYAGAPIRVEDEIIGFLNLDSMFPNVFTPDHEAPLQAFADQAGVALKNAELFANLTARNQELYAFSHTVAHDLKAPLQILLGYADLLKRGVAKTEQKELMVSSDMISSFALKMGTIIDSLLLLAEVRGKELELATVDMQATAESAALRFENLIQSRGITLAIDEDMPSAMTYGPWIEEVFANLIGNAVKYIGRENPAPRIEVRGYTAGLQIVYEVIDNGLGISEDDQKNLFQPFARFHKTENLGHGLGLTITQRILHKLKGEISATSKPGEGTTFRFNLPISKN